jgi:hypothetical protein
MWYKQSSNKYDIWWNRHAVAILVKIKKIKNKNLILSI